MIAIVEDEKELQDSLKALLESKGYDTVTAASCSQAFSSSGPSA